MKKEVMVAIIIGFGVGLLITVGIYTAQKLVRQNVVIVSPLPDGQKKAADITPQEVSPSLSLVSPLDESISKEAKVSVIGTTISSAWILILTEKGEKVIQADIKGNFETEALLVSGENEIEVKSLSDKGVIVSKVVTVVYSTAEI